MGKLSFVKSFLIYCMFYTIFCFGSLAESHSIGVSPSYFINERLSLGASFTQDYIISRSDPTKEINAVIDIQMEDANSWFTVEPSNKFALPKNQNRVNMKINVKVPENAIYKEYKGIIIVKIESETKEGQVNFLPAVQLNAKLVVTSEKEGLLIVKNTAIPDFAKGNNLLLKASVANAGNADTSFDNVTIEISDINKKVLKTLVSLDKVFQKSFTDSELYIDMGNPALDAGSYFANVKMTAKNLSYKNFLSFNITKTDNKYSGISSNTGNSGNVSNINLNIYICIGILFLLLALIAIIIFVIKENKDRTSRTRRKRKNI